MSNFKNIKDGISVRLRQARERLGMKQSELAGLTGVSRSTQIAYEKGSTAPTTDYLQAAERVGIDIQKLLFDRKEDAQNLIQPDWKLIQECAENVEFFCLRFAPTCPSSFRWKMIAELYATIVKERIEDERSMSTAVPREVLDKIWADYGK